MPRPTLQIPEDDDARWRELRACAYRADQETRSSGLDPSRPILDRIAWLSGFPEPSPDPVLCGLIEEARAQRFTWREISAAVGEATDRNGQGRTQARQYWRRSNL